MFRAIGVTFGSSLLTIICHFVTLMILIRVLNERMMGVYFIVLLMTHLLVLISDFGIELALLKKHPEEDRSGKASLLRMAAILRFAICCAVSLIFIALITIDTVSMLREIAPVLGLTLIFYWLHSFRGLQFRVLQAEKLFTAYAGAQALGAALKVVFVLVLIPFDDIGVRHVLVVEVASILASVIYASSSMKRQLIDAFNAEMTNARDLVYFGFPLYLNAIVNLGNARVSSYIVAAIGGPVAIAFFNVADQLADACRRLFSTYLNVYLPMQTNHFATSEIDLARKLASRSMLWIAFIIGAGTVAFAIVREPAFLLLFTSKYVAAADTSVMFFGVLVLYSLQALMGYFGVAAGHNYFPVKVSLISSIFNIAATLWLYNAYGYEGAAAALILTQGLINVLYLFWLWQVGLKLDVLPVLGVLLFFSLAVAWIIAFSNSIMMASFAFPAFVSAVLLFVPAIRADIAELMQRFVSIKL